MHAALDDGVFDAKELSDTGFHGGPLLRDFVAFLPDARAARKPGLGFAPAAIAAQR
jgi:hypothetical protein